VKGVTGSQAPDVEEVGRKIEAIRKQSKLPIGVGFGIRDAHFSSIHRPICRRSGGGQCNRYGDGVTSADSRSDSRGN